MTDMIRAARIETLGQDPVIARIPLPQAQPGQVLLRMSAAALNFADVLQAKGQYQERLAPPFVPGLEGAGTVLACPPDSGLAPGMRVVVSAPATLAEVIAVPPQAVQPIPDAMSFEQAAGFQVAYGTSHLALTARGQLAAGQTLVVLGAAGGVGLTAVQIGVALGARVIGVVRGADKMAPVREAGAQEVVDSTDCPDLRATLREMGGADVIYDPVGAEPGEAAFGALHPGGHFLAIGFAGGRPPVLPLNHALVKNITIHGFYWGSYRSLDPQALRASMAALFELFAAGRLHPVASDILPLERVAEGYDLLRQGRSIGKVVITL
ncbi:NADPH:quinone oxidoreductase family protein [Paracoccus gahaiensis]|uniref:NADPH:quinone oxidoreductase family protein n=1 Tax=Paracoccus gahaiensis TaxID=1706839 RepID=A0A4U0REH5_9RHOB|nr:NADPH:quinone oxidoreductase family protein [Paracoccus gahaiensis]